MARFFCAILIAFFLSNAASAVEVPPTLVQKISKFFKSLAGKSAQTAEEEASVLNQHTPKIDPNLKPLDSQSKDGLMGYFHSREFKIEQALRVIANNCNHQNTACKMKIEEIKACLDREYQPPRSIEFASKICDKTPSN